MRNLSWTLLAVLAVSWGVQSRSIDSGASSSGSDAVAVDAAAEIMTVESIGSALNKAINTEVQRVATAQQQAVAQVLQLAEGEAIGEILQEAAKNLPLAGPGFVNSFNSPNLDFESGSGDSDNEISGTRDKRTIGAIGRLATCFFTILTNPNCFQELGQGGGGGGGGPFAGLLGGGGGGRSNSRSSARQEAYNRQLRQWMALTKQRIAKLNETEGGNYTTPFPILPPSPPIEDDSDSGSSGGGGAGGGGFISQIIQFKLNLIPNLFRTARSLFQSVLPFVQNLGGGGGGSGGGGGGLGGLFGGLGGGGGGFGGGNGGSFGGSSSYPSSSGNYGSGSSSSGSSSSLSGSGSSGSGSAAETSTYRISLG